MIADDTSLLQLVSLVNSLVSTIKTLLCASETAKYIRYTDEIYIEDSDESAPAENEQVSKLPTVEVQDF